MSSAAIRSTSVIGLLTVVFGSVAACASLDAVTAPTSVSKPTIAHGAAENTPLPARAHARNAPASVGENDKQTLTSEAHPSPAAARVEPMIVSPDVATTSTTPTACPGEMVLVEGEYCTEVEQTCIDWMEQPTAGGVGRCRKFAPSVCKGERVHKRFCIDRDEYTAPNETLPENYTTYISATDTCEKEGKRLCKESEWNFACEGEEMLPYPIGYERDANKCNYDQSPLLDTWGEPRDLRRPSAELTECVSPFGVRNMTGNVDEWTDRDVTWGEYSNAMKGGWWMAARNRCRPATTAHWDHYSDFQTGFRCCSDAH
jgi:hypothetical protein